MMPSRHSSAAERAAAGIAAGQLDRGGDLLQQLLAVERLGEVAEHAALRGGDRVRDGAVRGEDEHGQPRMLAIDRVEQLEAVDAGHAQVGDDDGRPPHGDGRQRRLAAFRGADPVARGREPQADELQEIGVVIDQENVAAHRVLASATAASAAAATARSAAAAAPAPAAASRAFADQAPLHLAQAPRASAGRRPPSAAPRGRRASGRRSAPAERRRAASPPAIPDCSRDTLSSSCSARWSSCGDARDNV